MHRLIEKLHIGKVTSIIDLLKRSNRVLNNDDPLMEILPASEQAIAQQLLLLESSGDPNDLEVWIDNQQQQALLWIQIKDPYASTTRQILPQLEQLVKQYIPELKVYFGGPAQVNVAMADMVVSSQLSSLGLSFVAIFLVLMLIYRSLSWTFLAMLPLTIALLSIFAILAITDRYIDIPLAVLASISLGLAIDYAIYVLDRYRQARLDGQAQAVQHSLSQSGSIVLLNSIILAIGFSILVLSQFAPLTAIGLLTAGVLLISASISLLLPILASHLSLK
ncbi:MMPL family transporter [sulfur-oxidizing endosymbiont of Gigantopelta aegis]|uniref:MMPL family transporter n=1 Tax=sulfur-oxidizing endosymbiont of Gigantopelta aegis TaxID=2794934 RepID=UPI0018DB7239|nr:MMPL family transporter [sulfur-oxidizing endosymbiont of Gigantopelta aegis]